MFFKTLTRKIDIDISDTILKNETYEKYKFNAIEDFIVNNAKNPILHSLKFSLFYALFSFILFCVFELIYNFPPYLSSIEKWEGITSINDIILTSQLTILALIFPLIIGFVGVLFKDDVANKSLWRIYGRYSGFLLVGYSGLLLTSVILIIKYFLPFIESTDSLNIVLSLSIITWFLFNIFLLGWMIYATFEFIKIETQNQIIIKYATNVVIIMEIKKRLFNLIPRQATTLKLLPVPSKNMEIEFFSFRNSSQDSVNAIFKKEKYLNEINFTFLSWMIKSIVLRTNCCLIKQNIHLILPITGSGYPNKYYTLAELKSLKFTLLEKLLIKSAYKFSDKNLFEDDDVKNIVNSFFNNIDNAMKQDSQRVFEDSVDNLQAFMQTIFSTTSFINDHKEIDNWLLLSDNSFFSNRLLNELLSEFYALNNTIINKSIQSNIYFRKFCYFYQYAYQEKDLPMHSSIKESLMNAHYYLWYQLVNNPHIKSQPFFDDLCMEYIGGWESWSNRKPRDINDWDTLARTTIDLYNHMVLSTKMVVAPLKTANNNASLWAINILNNWYENFFSLNNTAYHSSWKTKLISTSLLCAKCNNQDVIKYLTNNEIITDFEDLCNIALENTWKQAKIITAAYLLNGVTELSSSTLQLIFGLINGHKITPYKQIPQKFNTQYTPTDLLETYILNSYSFTNLTHNNLASTLIDGFHSIYEEKRITGRVYSGFGRTNISNIKGSLISIIIAVSNRKFELSDDIYDFIFSEIFTVDSRDALIRDINALNEINEDALAVAKNLTGNDEINDLLKIYKKSIESIIKKIEDRNNREILSKPISPSRMEVLKSYCSKSAFSKKPKKVPMNLFSEIIYDEQLNQKYFMHINLSNVEKRNLIEDYDQHSVNEDSFYANLVKNEVEIKIYRDMFSYIETNQLITSTESYDDEMNLLVSMLQDSNIDNVIFIGSQNVLSLLYRIRWDKTIDIPFNIIFDKTDEDDYICTINNIPVYSLRKLKIDYCLLIKKSFFKSLTFKKYDEGIFVDTSYTENTDDLTKGILRITYGIKVSLDENVKIKKYIFLSDEEDI
ncbi:hypothetical protein [Sulfurovum sp.]|uniref:hypothetical protein n=1 Tax=Sulfurovum sp. TaxID=1969726 RepID=UPI002A35ED8F|nr:hypothetical protein [Sulfurovum sp.]MDD3500416.1 hypothetical protein [Sulfurovum sp.]MDY0403489.1 hypothetical protein [Sulfurovum sp.]